MPLWIDAVTSEDCRIGAHCIGDANDGAGIAWFVDLDRHCEQAGVLVDGCAQRYIQQIADGNEAGRRDGIAQSFDCSIGDKSNTNSSGQRPIDDVLIALGRVLCVEEIVYRAGLAVRECTVQQFGDRVLALDEETSCFASFCCAQELDSRNDPRSPLGERVHGPLL
ncbi:hypothetical protein GCM10020255_084520 [Rhodococcus baikonurensis]